MAAHAWLTASVAVWQLQLWLLVWALLVVLLVQAWVLLALHASCRTDHFLLRMIVSLDNHLPCHIGLQIITYIRDVARLHTVNNPAGNITAAASTTCGSMNTAGLTQLVSTGVDDVAVQVRLPFAFSYLGKAWLTLAGWQWSAAPGPDRVGSGKMHLLASVYNTYTPFDKEQGHSRAEACISCSAQHWSHWPQLVFAESDRCQCINT